MKKKVLTLALACLLTSCTATIVWAPKTVEIVQEGQGHKAEATADLSGSYYERKAYLYQNGNLPQEAYDFAKDFSPCPHNYRDADEEMKAYNP